MINYFDLLKDQPQSSRNLLQSTINFLICIQLLILTYAVFFADPVDPVTGKEMSRHMVSSEIDGTHAHIEFPEDVGAVLTGMRAVTVFFEVNLDIKPGWTVMMTKADRPQDFYQFVMPVGAGQDLRLIADVSTAEVLNGGIDVEFILVNDKGAPIENAEFRVLGAIPVL